MAISSCESSGSLVVIFCSHIPGRVSARQKGLARCRAEKRITACSGFENDTQCTDEAGNRSKIADLLGQGYALPTEHSVPVFFLGIGEADFEVGRLLAEASGGAFRGAKPEEIRALLEQFSKYF